MRALADRFKALSEETRLEILALIQLGGELCVCDVVGVLGVSQSKASRHLRYLAHAGLLTDRRDGIWVHYAVPTDPDPQRDLLLAALERLLPEAETRRLQGALADWNAQKLSGSTCQTA